MSSYEYKTVALSRTVEGKRRRRQSEADLVAEQLGRTLNEEAVDGWEYLRAETLTTPGRKGMFQKGLPAAYVVLIFRRLRSLAWDRPEESLKRSVSNESARAAEPAPARHSTPPPREPEMAAALAPAPTPKPLLQGSPDLRIASTSGQLVSRVEPVVTGDGGVPRQPLGPANE